jgi:uncharacterized protein (TIGR02246 family)
LASSKSGTPEQAIAHFSRCVRERDLDGLVALYEPSAVLVPEPGSEVSGHQDIRGALQGLLAMRPELEVVTVEVHRAGDVALITNEWKLKGTGPDGAAVAQSGRSSVVLRQQPDASWRLLIDRP